jgi:hypothetical protein
LVWVIDDRAEGLEHDVTGMPAVPVAATLPSYEELELEGYPWFPFWRNLETREIGRRDDRSQPGPPVWRAWLRYRPVATFDDPFVDAGRAVVLLDTMSCRPPPGPHLSRAVRRAQPGRVVQFTAGTAQ